MTLEWISVSARTGRKLAELPDLMPGGALKRTLGRADTLTCTLPWTTAPTEWRGATKPGASVFVAVDPDRGDTPVWGGLGIVRRRRWSADPDASLLQVDMVTLEAYLARRYVGDVTYTGVGQNLIVADIVTRFIADGDLPGLPIRVETHGIAGQPRDRTYADTDDHTIESVLTDLTSVIGGPEWTIEWEFTPGPSPTYTPVFEVASRIGTDPTAAGLAPVSFDLDGTGGCVLSAEVVESYEQGKGANRVTATGQKTGDDRAQVTFDDLSDGDRPTFEYRGSVSTSNSDTESLADHAAAALALTAPGQLALTLVAAADEAPPLGVGALDGTWRLGDTIRVDLSTPDGGDQGRVVEDMRCIGWERDTVARPETVTPILLVPAGAL